MVINQNDSSPNTIDAYVADAAQLPIKNVTTSPAAGAPPAYGSAPPAAPPAAAPPSSPTPGFGFGGGAPPATATTTFQPPPAVATVTSPSSTVSAAPAVFTGAAAPGFVPQSSTGIAGLLFGVLLALW